ncbi:ROK family transcriptional regulator [Phytoactinopolyspora halotolerans]|uniref:ROK family transcriptional regulator n=1 Tax=Phytoactinopolyspora halotolerans TaxID=1981512 RepID=A0A6L9SGL0_9ACTN|nr:ROK family transcriptional regulator [Phytoactinopolyspora halotolerans]NEE03521.1 ROK family transcriptional regulator [Phytoactinopolyspora halotolerans]
MRDGRVLSPAAVPVDHLALRRHNLAVVVNRLRADGPRSRARIAADTGLTKATVSSLVAELVELGLVRDGELERDGGIGRPGQTIELDGRVCGLGVEIRPDGVAIAALDLRGTEVIARHVMLDTAGIGAERALDAVAEAVVAAATELRRRGLRIVGLTVAVPGLVDAAAEMLTHSPTLSWREVAVVDGLSRRLTGQVGPVRLENDANLGARAEYATGAAAGCDLVYLSGYIGVGAGIVVGGALLRGADGYGGEVGHLPIGDRSHVCGCGRRGCWETEVGLGALLREVADPGDPLTDMSAPVEQRLAEIRRRAELGDGRTVRGLQAVAASLSIGCSMLADLVNPRVIILGGYFAVLSDFLTPAVETELDRHRLAAGPQGCRIERSTLGFAAACWGGAHIALETVLTDPASTADTAVQTEVLGGTT